LCDRGSDFGNLSCGVQNRGFKHDVQLNITAAVDLYRAFAILESGLGHSHRPGAARDLLEIGDPSGLCRTRGEFRGSRPDSDLRVEDGSLLGVFHEDAQLARLAGLGAQLSCSDKQEERDVTSRMS